MKKILFLGDVVGSAGRKFIFEKLAEIRAGTQADFIVINAENAAAGSGINASITRDFIAAGTDAVTLGDHVWDQRGFETDLPKLEKICRPANLPEENPGATHLILTAPDGFRLLVFTVLAQTFMNPKTSCPFRCAEKKLADLAGTYDAALVEIHGEATSEKIAFGRFLDGRAAAVVGTHTHVATADECILPAGTAYQTDAGMCGPHSGVIGRETQAVLGRFLDGRPRRFEIAEGDVQINGCLISYDETQKRAVAIERFRLNREVEN
ncbi:MAG: YmdB family metallophosphoesterase [Opitutales bacterium]|nr:YmdB family metallophosphoesterase [Opitutales bacterium]